MPTKRITIEVTIAGDPSTLRTVEASVMDDQPEKAFLLNVWLVNKFRTGTKLHTSGALAWRRPNGWEVSRHNVIHNHQCRVMGWKDQPGQTNSGWTG